MATQDCTVSKQRNKRSLKDGSTRARGKAYSRFEGKDDSGNLRFLVEVYALDGYTPSKVTVTYT